jgi:hypothetical protein
MKLRCFSAVAGICFGAALLSGQDFRSTLTGRVIDPSDSPVPEAAVSIQSESTNVTYSAKSDSRGNYTAILLPPGSYSVTVTAAGFKAAKRSNMRLTVAETSTLDFKLELGGLNQEVTVTAEVPILESASADRGMLLGAEEVAEFPLNGRNPLMLGDLVPGVIYNGEMVYQRSFDNGAIARFDISGSSGTGGANNEFLLEGAPNNAQAGTNNVAYVPPVDAVQEFKIQTTAFDAQYGKSGGGVINVALKSGGNRLHGALYEFMRRNDLDANSFQNNAQGAPRGGHYLDQYGGEIDGPIRLPKIYNGHDRTFFMFSYEGYREGSPQPLVLSVPAPEMRTGDFSKLYDGSGRLITIYDPQTTKTSSPYARTPFANNIIPASRIDPIAAKIATYFPQPNIVSPGFNYTQNNYFAPGGYSTAIDSFYNMVFKIDHNIGQRNHVFLHGASNNRTEMRGTNGIEGAPGADGPLPLKRVNKAYELDWVSTLSPTMIFDAHLSYGRYIEGNFGNIDQQFDMKSLGFPASMVQALPYNPGFGYYTLSNYIELGKSSPSNNVTSTWGISGAITKVSGTHTTKVGYDARWIQYAVESPGTVFQLSENTVFTCATYNNCDAASGNSLAGWLLGTPSSGTVTYNSFFIYMQPYMAPWVQHDWRVTSKLSLNLGLRFDFNFPPNERFNRLNRGFDETVVSPLDSMVNYAASPGLQAPIRGGLLFAGLNGAPTRASDLYLDTWQPRIGVAYSLTPSTVLRGGWGRYYVNPSNNYQQSTGFNASTTLTASNTGNQTEIQNVIDNPFPTINTPQGASAGLLTYAGRSFNFVNTNFAVPHVDLYNFGVQRRIGTRGKFEVTYVASRGRDLESTKSFDVQGSGAFRDACNPLLGHATTYCNAGVTNPFRNLAPFIGTGDYTSTTVSRNTILTPYPQFTGLTEYMLNTGRSWYNALQALYTMRMHNGINLNVNYTFSKNEARTGYLDPQNDVMQQGLVQYDRPNRFVTSMVWQLPFGKGHRWMNSSNRFMSRVFSGWEQTIMFQIQSGQPWALPSNVLYVQNADLQHGWSGSKIQVIKPCVAQQNDDGSIVMEGFSKDYGCTTYNFLIVNQTYNPRYTPYYDGQVRYQTIKMADVSLNKVTQINERLRFQIRAECFNIANSFFVSQFSTGTQAIDNVATDPTFGALYKSTVSATLSNYPRQIQLGFKLLW